MARLVTFLATALVTCGLTILVAGCASQVPAAAPAAPRAPRPDGGPPVQVLAMPPPGHATLTGAATGAIIGAAVSDPWHSGEGAAIGAVAGAVIGAASDAGRQQTAQQVLEQTDAERNRSIAQSDAVVLDYRNAMKACFEARGYTVQ